MHIRSFRTCLMPVLINQGFEVAPLERRGPIDGELVVSLPLKRLRRPTEGGVDRVEIDLAKYRRTALQSNAGVRPKCGPMTLTGDWPAEDVYVGRLKECFAMCAYATLANPVSRVVLAASIPGRERLR